MARNVSLQLKLVNGATLAVTVPSSSTVSALKKIVAEKESIPVEKQRVSEMDPCCYGAIQPVLR